MGVFVPIWLVLRRCEATNLGVFDLCHFALISPYSNGAVQIRVGLELAEGPQTIPPNLPQDASNCLMWPENIRKERAQANCQKLRESCLNLLSSLSKSPNLVDVSDIFLFFFCLLGEGEGGVRGEGGWGVDFLLKVPGGGGVSRRERGRGAGRVSGRIGEFGGGGLNIFFRGRNVHQANYYQKNSSGFAHLNAIRSSSSKKFCASPPPPHFWLKGTFQGGGVIF